MRQDFFTYEPQFTLVVAGNTKPSLRGVGEAIRRRFHLVPFNVVIPPAERDKALAEKLRAEWPAILRWAIDGCLAWQRDGLAPPAGVAPRPRTTSRARTWSASGSRTAARKARELREERDKLFASWCEWSERNRGPRHSSRAFYGILTERGFEQSKSRREAALPRPAACASGRGRTATGQEGQEPPISTRIRAGAHARTTHIRRYGSFLPFLPCRGGSGRRCHRVPASEPPERGDGPANSARSAAGSRPGGGFVAAEGRTGIRHGGGAGAAAAGAARRAPHRRGRPPCFADKAGRGVLAGSTTRPSASTPGPASCAWSRSPRRAARST